jgi:hypothetical protein
MVEEGIPALLLFLLLLLLLFPHHVSKRYEEDGEEAGETRALLEEGLGERTKHEFLGAISFLSPAKREEKRPRKRVNQRNKSFSPFLFSNPAACECRE